MITKPLPGIRVDPLHNLPELIAYWAMNEGSGSRVNDISGHGNHGTLKNVVPNTQGSGWCGSPHGGCVTLDGTDDCILCSKRNTHDIGSSDFTIEAVMRHDTTAANATIFYDVGNAPDYDGVRIMISSAGLLRGQIVYNNDWTINVLSSDRIDDSVWHHVVVTFDRDGNGQTYVDGRVNGSAANISTLAGDISNDALYYTIGKNYIGDNEYFGGDIEYVRLWRGLLTPSSIYTLSRDPFSIMSRLDYSRYYQIPWYDTTWHKRKRIILTGGASGAQSNYQVKLTVTWDSDMKTDFSDLRFTKQDGTTLLDAWMEDHTASTSATIWVETNTPANTVEADIFMYYGNANASSNWDGCNTFVKYADKDDYSTDFSSNGASISGDYISLGIAGTDSWGVNYLIATSAVDRTAQGYASKAVLKGTGTTSSEDECMFGFATNTGVTTPACDFHYNSGTTLRYYEDGSGATIATITWTNDNAYELIYPQNTGIYYYLNTNSVRNNAAYTSDPGKIRITPYSGPVLIKYVYVRKYVANPATYAFGSEEDVSVTGNPLWYYNMLRSRR